jgi:hypothetical protein
VSKKKRIKELERRVADLEARLANAEMRMIVPVPPQPPATSPWVSLFQYGAGDPLPVPPWKTYC